MKFSLSPIILVFVVLLIFFGPVVFSLPVGKMTTNDVLGTSIRSQINELGLVREVNTFFGKGEGISSKAIAGTRVVVLEPEKICISLGKYANDQDFKVIESGQLILSNANSDLSFRVVCDKTNELTKTFEVWRDADLLLVDLENECGFDLTESGKACVSVISSKEPSSSLPRSNNTVAAPVSINRLHLAIILFLGLFLTFFIRKSKIAPKLYNSKLGLYLILIVLILPPISFLAILIMSIPLIQIILSLVGIFFIFKHNSNLKYKLSAIFLLIIDFLIAYFVYFDFVRQLLFVLSL